MNLSEQDILRVVMKSRDRIAAAAWVVVRDAHAAEDIFQNVALKALKHEIQFPAEGALLSWAFITARIEALRTCLKTLPERSSLLLRLRYFEGRRCGDVAETLGMGLDAVYKRLSRVHRGLRKCIELRLKKLEATES